MLERGTHAGRVHATHIGAGELGNDLGITRKRAIADGTITDISFEGSGCAISLASASLMTMALKGLRQDDALALFSKVHTMLTTESDGPPPEIGKLGVLSGVWKYPTRVKCATLAWQAVRSALEESEVTDPQHGKE